MARKKSHFPQLAKVAAVTVAVITVGCLSDPAEISHYTVPKQPRATAHSPPQTAEPGRMLAAMIEQGDQTWFFKLTGPVAEVSERQEAFAALVESIRFDDDEPTWEAPEGWMEKPGSGMRYATIEVPAGESPLELTVTPLKTGAGDWDEYVLSNINRWRGELSLSPIGKDQVFDDVTEIELADGKALLVDLEGTLKPSGTMRPPFAPFLAGQSNAPSAAGADADIKYDSPDGWSPGELVVSRGGITIRRKAAFEVTDGDRRVEITVTSLPGAAGALLPNVNRWRRQIGLDPMSQQELDKRAEKIDIAKSSGEYIQLGGPADSNSDEMILGVIAERGGMLWYFKLQGDAELAEREKLRFESFVKSVQFQ